MSYDTFIFDLDGTLVNTSPEHRYTLVGKTLSDFGIYPQKNLIDNFWFQGNRDEIVTKEFGLSLEDFWRRYGEYDTIELRKQFTTIYEDVDFIQELRKNKCKIGMVTGAPRHIAELEIDMLGRENFDSIVIAHRLNGYLPKPNPQGLEECLTKLGSKKENSIYVGNADEDVLTARNTGILDVLTDRGEHVFPDINPSFTIKSLYELRRFL